MPNCTVQWGVFLCDSGVWGIDLRMERWHQTMGPELTAQNYCHH